LHLFQHHSCFLYFLNQFIVQLHIVFYILYFQFNNYQFGTQNRKFISQIVFLDYLVNLTQIFLGLVLNLEIVVIGSYFDFLDSQYYFHQFDFDINIINDILTNIFMIYFIQILQFFPNITDNNFLMILLILNYQLIIKLVNELANQKQMQFNINNDNILVFI